MQKTNSENKQNSKHLPPSVKERLPKYYRTLRALIGTDILRTSSGELGKIMKLTPSQVRQDFSYLGGVGHQGYGYNVKDLYSVIGNAIGIPLNYSAIIVCRKTDFASVLSTDQCFSTRGVNLKMIFTDKCGDFTPSELMKFEDSKKEKLTEQITNQAYLRAADYCRRTGTEIVVLACDKDETDIAAIALADAGVRGIWNFSGKDIEIKDKNISVLNLNLHDILLGICSEITNIRQNLPNE